MELLKFESVLFGSPILSEQRVTMKRRQWIHFWGLVWFLYVCWPELPARAQSINLYPDMFPYVDAHAPSNLQTLQAWQLSGTTLSFSTLFANKGDGLFEIRRGNNVSATRYELLQRVYIGTDFGSQYVDLSIGTAPIPNTSATAGLPYPTRTNVIWFEDFTKFSLLEAPIVNGVVTVGNEVASTVKTSWSLTPGVHLPGYSTVSYTSSDQAVQQRLSVGYGDLYSASTPLQSINISGVPIGPRYWLRQTVDPANRIHETDETNNSFEILIDLARPGEAITFAGEFVRPGDRAALAKPGDLNDDGVIDINDWNAFKSASTVSVAGLPSIDAYFLGDLDLDGKHSLHDVELFRQYFDSANGAGAFAAIQSVPEPTTWVISATGVLLLLGWCGVSRRRLRSKWLQLLILLSLASSATPRAATANNTLFFENFDGLTLGPNVEETLSGTAVWTKTAPAGWTHNDAGVPGVNNPPNNNGVTEWAGWSFANKDWWAAAAGDQGRAQFTRASGTVMIADPDEWDDATHPTVDAQTGSTAGCGDSPNPCMYDTFLSTPTITIPAGIPAGSLKLAFDSSWNPEGNDDSPWLANNQQATVTVSYNGGAPINVLKFDSYPTSSPYYHGTAYNEAVVVDLQYNGIATNMQLNFGLGLAENDWWWAIDNVHVFSPTVLEVNTATGKMTILGAAQITGYEIKSAGNSLNSAGWAAGNLDAQNFGPSPTLTADFNNTNAVDAADYVLWRNAVGTGSGGDANGDGLTDQLDFGLWRQQFARQLAAGQSWETLIATNSQLLEYYLLGNSTFSTRSIGAGYNTAVDARDLVFTYSTAAHQEFTGVVRYVSGAGLGTAEIPEPATWIVSVIGLLFCGHFPRAIAGQPR